MQKEFGMKEGCKMNSQMSGTGRKEWAIYIEKGGPRMCWKLACAINVKNGGKFLGLGFLKCSRLSSVFT